MLENQQVKVFIVWGTSDTNKAYDGYWNKLENSPVEYNFDSEKEANAFLKGIKEAIGWWDYCEIDEHSMEIYRKEKNK